MLFLEKQHILSGLLIHFLPVGVHKNCFQNISINKFSNDCGHTGVFLWRKIESPFTHTPPNNSWFVCFRAFVQVEIPL